MKQNKQSPSYKKFLMYLSAVFSMLLGITLVLVWWPDVVSLFRGFVGMAFALAGLLILYILNNQQ
jgi:uncharacterized membrane protein